MSKNLAKVCEGTLQLSRFVFFAMQYKNWYFYNTVMTFQERESFFSGNNDGWSNIQNSCCAQEVKQVIYAVKIVKIIYWLPTTVKQSMNFPSHIY